MAPLGTKNLIIMFGGVGEAGLLNDTWILDDKGSWTERTVSSPPPARYGHAVSYDSGNAKPILFGGRSGGGFLADTYLWDGTSWVLQMPAHSPPARNGHVLSADIVTGTVFLTGGLGAGGRLSDTWKWTGTDWEEVAGSTYTARSGHMAAVVGGSLILAGGEAETGKLGDVWTLSATGWMRMPPSKNLPPRSYLYCDSCCGSFCCQRRSGGSWFLAR